MSGYSLEKINMFQMKHFIIAVSQVCGFRTKSCCAGLSMDVWKRSSLPLYSSCVLVLYYSSTV